MKTKVLISLCCRCACWLGRRDQPTTQYPPLLLGNVISKAWERPTSEARSANAVVVICMMMSSELGIGYGWRRRQGGVEMMEVDGQEGPKWDKECWSLYASKDGCVENWIDRVSLFRSLAKISRSSLAC